MPWAPSRPGVRSCRSPVSLVRGLDSVCWADHAPPDPAPPSQEPSDAAQAVNREGGTVGAAGSQGRGETCGHVVSMAPACQILRWALALGLGLTFEVTHAFRSQGRGGPGPLVGREQEAKEGSGETGTVVVGGGEWGGTGSGSPKSCRW